MTPEEVSDIRRHYRSQEMHMPLTEYDALDQDDEERAWLVHCARAEQRAKQEAQNPILGLLAGLLGRR